METREEVFDKLNLLIKRELELYEEIDKCFEELKHYDQDNAAVYGTIRYCALQDRRISEILRHNYIEGVGVKSVKDFKTVRELINIKPVHDIDCTGFRAFNTEFEGYISL